MSGVFNLHAAVAERVGATEAEVDEAFAHRNVHSTFWYSAWDTTVTELASFYRSIKGIPEPEEDHRC